MNEGKDIYSVKTVSAVAIVIATTMFMVVSSWHWWMPVLDQA